MPAQQYNTNPSHIGITNRIPIHVDPSDYTQSIFYSDNEVVIHGNLTPDTSHGLPHNLTVNGYLDLSGFKSLTKLPERLTVNGDLFLRHCTNLTHLPTTLKANGSLYLYKCSNLTSLPDNLTVKQELYLNGCVRLASIPKSIIVGGGIHLGGFDFRLGNIDDETIEWLLLLNKLNLVPAVVYDGFPGKEQVRIRLAEILKDIF